MSHRQQQLRSAQAFRDLGFGNEASALAALPEKLQSDIIKNYWQRGGGSLGTEQSQDQGFMDPGSSLSNQLPVSEQQPQNELSTLLSQLSGGQQKPQQLSRQEQEKNFFNALGLPQKPKPIEQRLPELLGLKNAYNPAEEAIQDIKKNYKEDKREASENKQQLFKNQQQAMKIIASGKNVPDKLLDKIIQQKKPAGKPTVAEVLSRPYESPEMKQAERHFQVKQEQEQRKQEYKELQDSLKRSEEVRKTSVRGAEEARRTIHDLDRIEELSQSGKLDTPGYVEFLHRSGLDIPALMNPESEEFAKLQQGFLRDAKQYFGGRVSNYEVEQFLKTIPSLSQSPEGRQRVISNLKYLARGKLEHFKTLREIIKENKNVPPYDLEEQVFERLEPKLDVLSKKFREDLKKPVPKGQNKFITALQASTGSLIGNAGKIIKPVAGAVVGGALGGPAGAGIGGYLGSKL